MKIRYKGPEGEITAPTLIGFEHWIRGQVREVPHAVGMRALINRNFEEVKSGLKLEKEPEKTPEKSAKLTRRGG